MKKGIKQVEAKTFVLIQTVGATAGANGASGATGYLPKVAGFCFGREGVQRKGGFIRIGPGVCKGFDGQGTGRLFVAR